MTESSTRSSTLETPPRRKASVSVILTLVLGLSALMTSAAHAGYPMTVRSDRVYDGRGATINAASLSRVFNVWSVKNVTIKNYTIVGSYKTRMFDISNSDGIRLENIKVRSGAADVVHIHNSSNVTVSGVVADTIDRYLVWIDNSDRVRVTGCALTYGSKVESGMRVMDWSSNVVVENTTIRNKINKKTALRLHDGSNFTVRNCTFEGHVWPGPMGGNEGGQRVTNLAERRLLLAKRTTNVLFENVQVNGSLGPQAGLSGFVMSGGTVTAKSGSPFFNSPFNNVTWTYPDSGYVKSGDVKRPPPTGIMKNVKFIAPGRTTLNFGTNGPFTPQNCTLNGKIVR